MNCDLVLRGGWLVDPANGIDGVETAGAGMNVGGLLASSVAFRDGTDPRTDQITSALETELEAGLRYQVFDTAGALMYQD